MRFSFSHSRSSRRYSAPGNPVVFGFFINLFASSTAPRAIIEMISEKSISSKESIVFCDLVSVVGLIDWRVVIIIKIKVGNYYKESHGRGDLSMFPGLLMGDITSN
jgi:hypothetical protein